MKNNKQIGMIVCMLLLAVYLPDVCNAKDIEETESEKYVSEHETEDHYVIKKENLKSEDGYVLKEIPWDLSPDEVAERLEIEFSKTPIIDNEEILVVGSKDILNILGYDATIEAEFHKNKFAAITFRLITEEADENYESLCKILEGKFGDPYEVTNNEFGNISAKGQLWLEGFKEESKESVLQVVQVNDDLTLALGILK